VGNCSVCHQQTWLEIPSGRKLEMDKKTIHSCKGVQPQQQLVNELPQTPREKRIDELAVARTAALERIAAAIEKNDNQNVAEALFFIGDGFHKLAESIKALVDSKKEISAAT
jgi:hypothetical protein